MTTDAFSHSLMNSPKTEYLQQLIDGRGIKKTLLQLNSEVGKIPLTFLTGTTT